MSRRCARVRGVSRCQKVAAPSWELTGTRRRIARTPAASRARVRRPGGVRWGALLGLGRGGVGDFIGGLRGANAAGDRRIEEAEIDAGTACARERKEEERKEGDGDVSADVRVPPVSEKKGKRAKG